jgi:NAD(P)H-dependent FMN reductase
MNAPILRTEGDICNDRRKASSSGNSDRQHEAGAFCACNRQLVRRLHPNAERIPCRHDRPGRGGFTRCPETLRSRLAVADAFIIITPEYNHSFPAPLKTAIDWYSKEWRARPVAFVAYGGNAGGFRAVEQLRQVFAELHSVTVRNAVGFTMVWEHFDEAGRVRDSARHEKAAGAMLDQLAWWGQALKDGRNIRPYPA